MPCDETQFSTTKLPIEWIKLVWFDSFNPLYLFCGLTLRLSRSAIYFTRSTSLSVWFSLFRLIYWFLLIYRFHTQVVEWNTAIATFAVYNFICSQWASACFVLFFNLKNVVMCRAFIRRRTLVYAEWKYCKSK